MNAEHIMRDGLAHTNMCLDDAAFFTLIDSTGGWPLGFQFVGFEHTTERAAGFCNFPHNTGWWTVVASADDYYLWKLSPAAMQRVVDSVVDAIRLPRVEARRLNIKNSRGRRAAVSIAAQGA